MVFLQLVAQCKDFLLPYKPCLYNFGKRLFAFVVALCLANDALVGQQVLELPELLFVEQVVLVYFGQLALDVQVGTCLVDPLAVLGIGKPVLEIVCTSQIVKLLFGQIHLAAQGIETLDVGIVC